MIHALSFVKTKLVGDEDRANRKFGGFPAAVMSAVKISTKAHW